MITAFDLNPESMCWKPIVYTNLNGKHNTSDVSIVDAAMASSACPILLPIYNDKCDGGVWARNPSMAGLAAACDERMEGVSVSDCVVLSIGTGRDCYKIHTSTGNFGLVPWILNGIVNLLFSANIDAAGYYVQSMIGERYHRLDLDLGVLETKSVDDASTVKDLIAMADTVDIGPTVKWIKENWL